MIRPYRYSVDAEVVRVFSVLGKRQRERLLRIFDQLTENPFQTGDSIQRDHVGRFLQVKRFGEWTVTYWPEHLGEVVHVVATEHLRC